MFRLVLLSLLVGPALAQSPEVILSPGDVLPSGAIIDVIESAEVDADGGWIAVVRTFLGGNLNRSIVSSEGDELYEGGPVPGMPGTVADGLTRATRDDQGNTYCKLVADFPGGGFERIILQNFATPLWSSEDFLPGPGFSGTQRLTSMFHIEVNASGDLLVIGEVNDPNHVPDKYDAIVQFEIVGASVQSAALIVDGSLVPFGQAGPVNVFWTLESTIVLGDGGDVLWGGSISASPLYGAALAVPNQVLGAEGQPSPVAGRNWDAPFIPRLEVNAGGTQLMAANLDGSAASDLVYVLDGQPILQESDSAPALPGASYVILGDEPQLTDGGVLIHTARLSGQPFSQDRLVLADDEILVQEGLSLTTSGLTVQTVELSGLRASADGRWVLFRASPPGQTTASLMLLERAPDLGMEYCSAEPNSTGGAAATHATGSLVIADQDFRLFCDGMPNNQPGFFLTSQAQANVPLAGGSQGTLCLGGNIGRFNASIQNSGASGSIGLVVDLNALPFTPPVAVQTGETWNFQTWFRDMNPGQTSNFALPTSVVFQ